MKVQGILDDALIEEADDGSVGGSERVGMGMIAAQDRRSVLMAEA